MIAGDRLDPGRIAYRVAVFAGGLGFVGLMLPGLHTAIAFGLALAAAIFLYELWIRRASPAARRSNLIWALLCLASAGLVFSGFLRTAANALLALAAVCAALGWVATLSRGEEEEQDSETLH